jgi:hypothetical protein
MTPTESAPRLLRVGARVQWPVQRDPKQYGRLTQLPAKRTVRGVHGREVVFDDGTRLALPPDANIGLGTTPDGKIDTLTLIDASGPSATLIVLPPAEAGAVSRPVRSLLDIRERCFAGAWVECERGQGSYPPLQGLHSKVQRAVGVVTLGREEAVCLDDRSLLDLPKIHKPGPGERLRFQDGNLVTWSVLVSTSLFGGNWRDFRVHFLDAAPTTATR